ncbi:hypothetical protein ACIO3O_34790 [Streptomyces sp. NPDC087440]|uniref:hypothetical protein n=1 Tax=Streptomyces sp. NPDC087440 TaxID=3365790 RepID=UPI0038256587
MTLAIGVLVAALNATTMVLVRSQVLHDDPATARAVIIGVPLIVSAATFAVAKVAFARRPVRWQQAAVATVVLAGLTLSAGPVSEHFYPDPMTRYARELSGPGECLHVSPYASEEGFPRSSRITVDDPGPGQMTITPVDEKAPPLRLDHAVRGGTRPLTPADDGSASILTSYGC